MNKEAKKGEIYYLLLIDIEGFTSFSSSAKPEVVSKTVADFEDKVKELCEKFSGEVVKFLGDGAIIVFRSSEDALEVGKRITSFSFGGLKIRAFLHVGDVILSEDRKDVFGFHVNFAFRMLDTIKGGFLGISEPVFHIITRGKENFKATPLLSVKGVEHPVKIFVNGKSSISETEDVKLHFVSAPLWRRALAFYLDILIFASSFGILSGLLIGKFIPDLTYKLSSKSLEKLEQGNESAYRQQDEEERILGIKTPIVELEGKKGRVKLGTAVGQVEAEPGKIKFLIGGKEISISYVHLGGIQLIFFSLYLGLFWFFWKGKTPGGWLLGIKVQRADGSPLDLGTSLLRSFLTTIFFIFLGLGAIIPFLIRGKTGQDILARTRVIMD
jgi:uncharacterized RDD family membrane protein YckC